MRRFQSAEESRGSGYLESRTKFRGRSQHLALEHGKGVVTLYLDESGQAQPSLDQPVFVLAGVAMDDVSATHYIERANALKTKFGISQSVCLHGPQIEKGVDEFAFQGDGALQSSFREAIANLVRESDFKLIGAIIRKDSLAKNLADGEVYGNLPVGLYEMALTFVVERFVDALHYDQVLRPCGRLVFESIGNLEDALHQRAFAELLIHGSEFVSDGCFRGCYGSVIFYKPERSSVYAVTQAGWGGAVAENVAKMAAASGTSNFVTIHEERLVFLSYNRVLPNGLEKAGPPGTGVEFCFA